MAWGSWAQSPMPRASLGVSTTGAAALRSDRSRCISATRRAENCVLRIKQHREELRDGRHTTTAPARRKLAVSCFRKFGGSLLQDIRLAPGPPQREGS